MRIFYGIQLHGQGHLNRSAEMIRRLRERGHQVEIFICGKDLPKYAQTLLGSFEFFHFDGLHISEHKTNLIKSVWTNVKFLPSYISLAHQYSKKMIKNRIDWVITDFEPISAYASHFAKIPVAGIAGQYRITRTDALGVFEGDLKSKVVKRVTEGIIEVCTPRLDHYFAVTFCPLKANRIRTHVVGPVLNPEIWQLSGAVPSDFILAYLYTYPRKKILQAFKNAGRVKVYGMDRSEKVGNIEFCKTDRNSFLSDLSTCSGIVFSGSFQGACEAAALKKPALSIPFHNQFEELFNAELIERSRIGMQASELSEEIISRFQDYISRWTPPHDLFMEDGAQTIINTLGL